MTHDTQHFGIRIEKSLVKLLREKAPPLSNASDLARKILRDWAKKNNDKDDK